MKQIQMGYALRLAALASALAMGFHPVFASLPNLPTSQTTTTPPPESNKSAAATPAENITQTQASGQGALGAASLSVTDKLDLVTTSVFNGGIKLFSLAPNVMVSSTLTATKPVAGTSTKYQDTELLNPHGGVLNVFFSSGSVNVDNATHLAQKAATAGSPIGRQALSDRHYIDDIEDILTQDKAYAYFINGIGVRMLNRNVDATTSPDASNYGISGLAYLGLGADGAFIPIHGSNDQGGQYRAEVYFVGSWTDPVTIRTLYPKAIGLKDFNMGLGANLQIVITNRLGVNVQAGWPLGSSRKYMSKILLAGITLSK